MTGRPISKTSKEIIKLINKGLRQIDIVKKGYAKDTVRYYIRKIKMPRVYKKFVKTITIYNRKRHNNLQ
jgi:hypothetical protein